MIARRFSLAMIVIPLIPQSPLMRGNHKEEGPFLSLGGNVIIFLIRLQKQ